MSYYLSVIIPCHNEQNRLPNAVEAVCAWLAKQPYYAEVLIVANACTDDTLRMAQDFAIWNPAIRVIEEPIQGKGAAVRAGMLAAHGDYRLFADVDWSMPVEMIERFIPPAVDAPIVIGSREAAGAVRYNEPARRHITGRVFNSLIRALVLPDLHDTQCGFKMFRADVVEQLFRRQTMRGFSFDVELLYMARLLNIPVTEIPVHWYYNPQSTVNLWRDSRRMLSDLFEIRRNGRAGVYSAARQTGKRPARRLTATM